MVLFVFAIMMLAFGPHAAKRQDHWLRPEEWVGPTVLSAILMGEFLYILGRGSGRLSAAGAVQPKEVGIALFAPYLLGVELASMLLLAGIVGAYCLGRHDIPRNDYPKEKGEAS
jgi:NADH-quinone oxidoreductase subunit J